MSLMAVYPSRKFPTLQTEAKGELLVGSPESFQAAVEKTI